MTRRRRLVLMAMLPALLTWALLGGLLSLSDAPVVSVLDREDDA